MKFLTNPLALYMSKYYCGYLGNILSSHKLAAGLSSRHNMNGKYIRRGCKEIKHIFKFPFLNHKVTLKTDSGILQQ